MANTNEFLFTLVYKCSILKKNSVLLIETFTILYFQQNGNVTAFFRSKFPSLSCLTKLSLHLLITCILFFLLQHVLKKLLAITELLQQKQNQYTKTNDVRQQPSPTCSAWIQHAQHGNSHQYVSFALAKKQHTFPHSSDV